MTPDRYSKAPIDPPSYSAVTIYAADGVTKTGTISQAALQARAKPTRRNQPPMSRRRTGLEDAYPTVPKRTRETWHPKRGRGGPTMEESAW